MLDCSFLLLLAGMMYAGASPYLISMISDGFGTSVVILAGMDWFSSLGRFILRLSKDKRRTQLRLSKLNQGMYFMVTVAVAIVYYLIPEYYMYCFIIQRCAVLYAIFLIVFLLIVPIRNALFQFQVDSLRLRSLLAQVNYILIVCINIATVELVLMGISLYFAFTGETRVVLFTFYHGISISLLRIGALVSVFRVANPPNHVPGNEKFSNLAVAFAVVCSVIVGICVLQFIFPDAVFQRQFQVNMVVEIILVLGSVLAMLTLSLADKSREQELEATIKFSRIAKPFTLLEKVNYYYQKYFTGAF